jgi:hypothetical protein
MMSMWRNQTHRSRIGSKAFPKVSLPTSVSRESWTPLALPTSPAVGNQEIEQELKDEAHGGSLWSLPLSRDAAC